jgi:glycosyltransferase involved in cell wall biosynthesis
MPGSQTEPHRRGRSLDPRSGGSAKSLRTYGLSDGAVMDIVMITNNALEDKTGGHERYVRELSSTFAGRDHRVTIVAKRWNKDQPPTERRPDGVVIERYAVPSKVNPLFASLYPGYVMAGVAARQRAHRGSVLHAHMGLPALPLALRRIPFVLTFHAPVWRELLAERQNTYSLPTSVQSSFVQALRAVESLVARRSTVSVVLSEFMRSELSLLDPAAAQRAFRIPGGIDASRFNTDGERQPNSGPLTLFTARRLTPRTGVDELIRAMPLILREVPDAQLKIAGVGQQAAELEQLARDTGAGSAIEFLGRISDEDLVAWYRRATLVVLPTRELEGFGLTTAEALACGAAVVGTPAGATPELLEPLDPGLVAADTTAEAIAAAVLVMAGDPERLQRARARAPSVVMPAMSWDAVADRYLDVYEQLGSQV